MCIRDRYITVLDADYRRTGDWVRVLIMLLRADVGPQVAHRRVYAPSVYGATFGWQDPALAYDDYETAVQAVVGRHLEQRGWQLMR